MFSCTSFSQCIVFSGAAAAASVNPGLFQKITTTERKTHEKLGKASARGGVAFVDNSGSTSVCICLNDVSHPVTTIM